VTNCDHIVAFHVGHEEIRRSELREKIRTECGEKFDWCCGGALYLQFCPDCGEELTTYAVRP